MPLEGPPPVARRIPRPCRYVGSRGPPPISRLRHRDSASGAFSPHEALSRRGARPTFGPDGSSPKGEVWAGRRSSTSAIETFREHDHGSFEPRSTARPVARALSFSRTSPAAFATCALPGCGWLTRLVRRRAYARRREDPCTGLPGVTSSDCSVCPPFRTNARHTVAFGRGQPAFACRP